MGWRREAEVGSDDDFEGEGGGEGPTTPPGYASGPPFGSSPCKWLAGCVAATLSSPPPGSWVGGSDTARRIRRRRVALARFVAEEGWLCEPSVVERLLWGIGSDFLLIKLVRPPCYDLRSDQHGFTHLNKFTIVTVVLSLPLSGSERHLQQHTYSNKHRKKKTGICSPRSEFRDQRADVF